MEIIEVNSPKSVKSFLNLPKKIYQNDKNWIPHLKQDIEKVFNPNKNKSHSKGKIIRWILLDKKQQCIGRIAAFIYHDNKHGGIGFFECINDENAAFKLFDYAKLWLTKNGATFMDGPINFGEKNMFWGLLTENFTDPNSYTMNYNPSYYKLFFEHYGFKIYYKQFMYKRDISTPVNQKFNADYNKINNDTDYNIQNVKGLSLDVIANDFRTVYNAAWGVHDNFKEMTVKTAQKIMKTLQPIYDPEIMIFVYYKAKPIAFYINIPELNEIFKHVNGNLNYIGKIKFMYHKFVNPPKTMVGIVFGIDKAFQKQGIDSAMIKWSQDYFITKNKYKQTVLTWVGDFNPKMLKICDNLDAHIYRTYHTYRYLFDREQVFKRYPMLD